MSKLTKISGRQFLIKPHQIEKVNKLGNLVKAIQNDTCLRCGQSTFYDLDANHKQCISCISLTAITTNDYLLQVPYNSHFKKVIKPILTWEGNLTSAQNKVSKNLLDNVKNQKDTLVHAVTGAGKTEMLFETIAFVLSQNKRVVICCPRVDVVNELYLRMQVAFSNVDVAMYHSQSHPALDNYQLIVCTTHQLMKFYDAFDLMIIDEVDAFPFAGSKVLNYAVNNALRQTGIKVFLTATPTKSILKLVKTKKLAHLILKKRYHGYLLPVPKGHLLFKSAINRLTIDFRLKYLIRKFTKQKQPLLIFVSKINDLIPVKTRLQKNYPQLRFETVSAKDDLRHQKIEQFRNGEFDVLITTTILERGVTFSNVQVIVLNADATIFTTAVLVQIAGRVGRKKDYPNGQVHFFYKHYTSAIAECVKQIKRMNK